MTCQVYGTLTTCDTLRVGARACCSGLCRRFRVRFRVILHKSRCTLELLIKDEKQHLGLGAYRVLRYRVVVIAELVFV